MKVTSLSAAVPSRRAFAVGALSTAAALLLSACSGAASSAPSSSAPANLAEAGASTITLWVDTPRVAVLKDVAAKFQADTGITVKLVGKDTVREDFITAVPTGKGPDLIVGAHDWLGQLVQNGVVAPLELGDKAALFEDSAVTAMTYEGAVYGVPFAIENIGLVRNTALAPEAATTFDDVIATGKKAVADGKASYPFLVGLDPKQGDPYHLYPLQTSLGAPVFGTGADGGYDAGKLELGTPGGIEFAKKLKQWGDKGEKVFNSNITGDIAKEKFIKGESPYFLTGPWNIPDIQKAGIKLAVDPLPTVGDKPAQPFIGVNGFFISSKSANALAATEFAVNYLSTEEVQDALFKAGGRPPALKASFEKASSDPVVKAFGEIGANGVPMPALPEMDAVWADWGGTELALIKGQGDPEAAWKAMVANVEKKIAQ
ncbi:maltose ABC transporter substrate-binding protein [Sinomonas halotolerans]|uniref:Maltose ABC transporter substrate-binding protein n=1 Tax=Sinomonas halotolerans TaxID=1644133 RepID=A0ABU9WW51_9MICC